MNKKLSKPPIPLLSRKWARVGLIVLFTLSAISNLYAQDEQVNKSQFPQNLNSELRRNTWSIYAEGGLSWATDVWYQNLNAKRSYNQSPAAGGGIDFTIRPWVRVGLE